MSKEMNGHVAALVINGLVHCCILWTILACFFFGYVKSYSQNVYREELDSIIDDQIRHWVCQPQVRRCVAPRADWTAIREHYEKRMVSGETMTQNKWLKNASVGVFTFTLLLLALVYQSQRHQVAIGPILKENMVIFLFVGLVEISFFLAIARNYVPVKPSLMTETVTRRIQSNLLEGTQECTVDHECRNASYRI